jgi:transitional endoplasmic reticulum ATPase
VLAGYASVKQRVYRTVVVPWRRQMSRRSSADGLTIVPPSGILFHGPSGCGKTMAANCLGSSLGLPMIKVRAADVLDQWLGGSEATLRSLFARARAAAPCILFLDELDALASNRSNAGDGSDVMSRLLSTFLNEMDGVSNHTDSNVLVVACTNRIHMLDAALLRPGRLEEHILLSWPNLEDALAILQQKLALAPVDLSIDWSSMAQHLVEHSASGADMEGLCREAIFRAMRRCSGDDAAIMVCQEDIDSAMVAMKLSEYQSHESP